MHCFPGCGAVEDCPLLHTLNRIESPPIASHNCGDLRSKLNDSVRKRTLKQRNATSLNACFIRSLQLLQLRRKSLFLFVCVCFKVSDGLLQLIDSVSFCRQTSLQLGQLTPQFCIVPYKLIRVFPSQVSISYDLARTTTNTCLWA